MKTVFTSQCLLLSSLGLMVIGVMGCKTTSETEVPQTYTVFGISGDARWSEGEGKPFRKAKLGHEILQGAIIQTASEAGNGIVLVTDKHLTEAIHFEPTIDGNTVILYENSILKIDKLTARIVNGKKIPDTRLTLSTGRAVCNPGRTYMPGLDDFSPAPQVQKSKL